MSREQGTDGRRRLERLDVDLGELVDGYQFTGTRGHGIAAWRERKDARDFAKLCERLRKRRWILRRREHVNAKARENYAKNAERVNERKREIRASRPKDRVVEEWTCENCGSRCVRTRVPGRKPKFCGAKCNAKAQGMKRPRSDRASMILVCERCGVDFTPRATGVLPRFCSRTCLWAAYRRKARSE